jgi:hypothetical protein
MSLSREQIDHSQIIDHDFHADKMAKTYQLKALFFDIFGTCVDWRKTVTETLINAAKEAGGTNMVYTWHHHRITRFVVDLPHIVSQ